MSGAFAFSICFRHEQTQQYQLGTASFAPGQTSSGTFEIVFPKAAADGTWIVQSVQVADQVRNTLLLSPDQLRARGFPTELRVISMPDRVAPMVVSYEFPPAIDTSASAATLPVRFSVADDFSGAKSFSLCFRHEPTQQYRIGYASFEPALSKEGQLTVDFPQFSAAGTWIVAWVQTADKAGNVIELYPAELAERGLPAKLRVTNDTTPPIIRFTVSPEPNQAGWHRTPASVEWTVADPDSGIGSSTGCEPAAVSRETTGEILTCTATNGAGIKAAVAVNIRLDMTPPVLTTPSNLAVDALTPLGAIVAYEVTATDPFDQKPHVECTPAAGEFAIGTTVVGCRATDQAGNTSGKTFQVFVRGAVEQTSGLAAFLDSLELGPQGYGMGEKVRHTESALASNNTAAACAQLGALIEQADGKTDGGIASAQAEVIITRAARIRQVVGCR